MRFENWDILLFPQMSGTPIQEFRTECFGVANPIGVTPTLNAYIPSLPRGTPFKISLHSWSRPVLQLPNDADGQISLAMHVAVDGIPVASVMLSQIDLNVGRTNAICYRVERINPDGNFPATVNNSPTVKMLFPPFHRVIRNQKDLYIADNVGRITVSLSEGHFYPDAASGKLHFRPKKNIVTFKWVHAPQSILRKAGISWPNGKLFQKPDVFRHNQIPPMFYPVDNQSTSSQESEYFVPPSMANSGVGGPFSYPTSSPPFHFFEQDLAVVDQFDLSDFTTSSDFSSGYTYGAPLSESIHAPLPTRQLHTTRIASDQVREIASAIVPELIEHGVLMMDGAMDSKGLAPPAERDPMRKLSDISMHASCDQFPGCVKDAANGVGVIHQPRPLVAIPSRAPRGRKRVGSVLTDKDINYRPSKKISKRTKAYYTMAPEAEMLRLSVQE
ncbi:hypothetical protein D6D24_04558 [Aureobasidium pullulans]|uniref:Uncharacterized protein n=1 Tax=Aureobasidium pullulans TaxID=5580 RepID=A0A4S9J2G8_AURPU|nr:hypothetical protein D6D24_04558 [Aureobasidium pullulans]THX95534.1 hypothetical protein D6D03_09189 [Aureobasidium pullulans]